MSFYIDLNESNPGFDPYVDGGRISASEDDLRGLAEELGVPPLMEFFGISDEELEDLVGPTEDDAGDLVDSPEGRPEPSSSDAWYEPADGLRTIRALLGGVASSPGTVADPEGVAEELREFERVLELAAERGLKWRLAVDL